jgi:hypothetical protein
VVIKCYSQNLIRRTSPSGCTTDPMTTAQNQAIAPFLYLGGLTPTVSVSAGANTLTVTASQPAFRMLVPLLGTALSAPSLTTTIPF